MTYATNTLEYEWMPFTANREFKADPKLIVRADSELVVRQMNGQYKVKSPGLKPLYERASSLCRKIPDCTFAHTYREGNARADALANAAMDKKAKLEPLGPLPGKGG